MDAEELHEKMELCLDVATIGTWTWNDKTNEIIWDKRMEAIFGRTATTYAEFELMLCDIEDGPRIQEAIAAASEIGETYEFDYAIYTPTGEKKFIRAFGKKMSEARHYGICMDITASKKMESDLKRSNEELEKFAYVASHDLKAPLRAITNLVSWIEQELDAPTQTVIEYRALLKGRITRMENLIDGLLEYSRIGKMNAAREAVSIQRLLDDVKTQMALISPHIELIFHDMPVVHMNPVRAFQVFSNLIDNAIKHHDKPTGRIEITSEDKGGRWLFCVSDDGPGIDERYHQKIFELFQTLVPKDVREATGIGLTLVRKIIQDSEGEISIESELGHGTKFYFTLPKPAEEAK